MNSHRRILVTSALPYANGPWHLGHALEAIQTDVWVRFNKLRGHECYYVCADDTHGTPIMLKARAQGISAEELIAQVHIEHKRDMDGMLIGLDNFGSTHSTETRDLCERMYALQRAAGSIDQRSVRQAYDESAQMFLPDRYVKGVCPVCSTPDQYGDSCENCGSTYTPADLLQPVSVISGTAPIWRESEHYFFKLSAFDARLREWIGAGAVQPSVARKLDEWFTQGLRDWDISRDAPYFGFEIPGAPGKYFYVWFDAPIGYLASFTEFCARGGPSFDDFFAPGSAAELHHFIGKDILYFHTLFWPAVLQASGMRRPTSVHAHGFLTINGQKMSKSRGTFITARRYLEHFRAEYLRYYFAAKLGNGIDDLDMNLEEFAARVNSDIVGKLVNIASRCAGFIIRGSEATLAGSLANPALYANFVEAGAAIAASYESRDTAAAVRDVMALADRANRFIDAHKPWLMARNPDQAGQVQSICTQGMNLFRVLMIYLQPILPEMAAKTRAFLGETSWTWEHAAAPLLGVKINPYQPLATRIDPKEVAALIEPEPASPAGTAEATKVVAAGVAAPAVAAPPIAAPSVAAPTAASAPPSGSSAATADANTPPASVSIEEFLRIDLRVARVLSAERVAGADKLLKLEVDLGELGQRTLFAGIRAAYDPAALPGRLIVVVANLQPRKMRFGTSAGMMLAAGPGGQDIFIVSPDAGAAPGMRIK